MMLLNIKDDTIDADFDDDAVCIVDTVADSQVRPFDFSVGAVADNLLVNSVNN